MTKGVIYIDSLMVIDFLTMFLFAIFGILFSIEKEDKILRLYHVLVVALFATSISFGLSYFMYIRYGIELDNRIVFTMSSLIGFGFEHFSIQQIVEGVKMVKNVRLTFKNKKRR